jgi:hypothetical protein
LPQSSPYPPLQPSRKKPVRRLILSRRYLVQTPPSPIRLHLDPVADDTPVAAETAVPPAATPKVGNENSGAPTRKGGY